MTAKFLRYAVVALCGMAFAMPALGQTQLTIGASKDNTLYEDATGATSNGAGEYFFAGRTNQVAGSAVRRGIIAFNLSTIPSNATITSVALTLNMSKTNSLDQTMNLHRVTADWGEGTSDAGGNEGSGSPSTPNDATWAHRFFSATLWTAPGGSFVVAPSASRAVGAIAQYTWGSTTGMVSDAQQWLNNPSSNFGWLILGNESVGGTAKRFDSRENLTTTNRPRLAVTYTTPTSVDEVSPNTFVLFQNYPNPFNPTTTIQFALGKSGQATLKVFNLLGQEVATLVNAALPAGSHAVQLNATHLSSGIYVYQLEANSSVATRKLVLTR